MVCHEYTNIWRAHVVTLVVIVVLVYQARFAYERRLFMLQTCRTLRTVPVQPSSKMAKAVYAARPLLMIPSPISLFLLLLLTLTPTVSGLSKWSQPMDKVSRVPDHALFHVDLQKAFALTLWGNRHHRRSSGSETMKDSRRVHAASTSMRP